MTTTKPLSPEPDSDGGRAKRAVGVPTIRELLGQPDAEDIAFEPPRLGDRFSHPADLAR
jgi:hypothetical protein